MTLRTAAPVVAMILTQVIFFVLPATAQTFTVLYSFSGGPDGGFPGGNVVFRGGSIYGTTQQGGVPGANGACGTLFSVDIQTGSETVLHSFPCYDAADGETPIGGLIKDSAGNLYGTTWKGPVPNDQNSPCFPEGCGTVFELSLSSVETLLHSFTSADGSLPYAPLVRDSLGNLYGTTASGGNSGNGTVFALGTTGVLTSLHSFNGGNDGFFPEAGLLLRRGNLYGTTVDLSGTVFEVNASTGVEAVLHHFTPAVNGTNPVTGVVADSNGNLYGTTHTNAPGNGCGVIFKLDLRTRQQTVLHKFAGPDGCVPDITLIRDSVGNLYGATTEGGVANQGTVYKLDMAGDLTTLHSFEGATDGQNPSSLAMDSKGNLYGATAHGGPGGAGTVFEVIP